MKKLSIVTIVSLLALVGFKTKNTETFKIIADESEVTWLASKVTGTHNGKVSIKEGTFDFNNDNLIGGSFTISMTTITCDDIENETYNKKLVDHLKSSDFFSVEEFNTANFKITSAKKAKSDKGNYSIIGDLTIKGITNSISFPAQVDTNDNIATANATIVFDRSKFDIKYRSTSFFDSLGDKAIYDDVEMTVVIKSKL